MVTRFGSREICNVTFKATTQNQRVGSVTFDAGQPVFVIDTATASSMEQATSTVYAQGGRGYNRLVAWEGEKTMTFRVTDALMSPMGLAVLAGAGLKGEEEAKHIHTTYDVKLDASGKGEITFNQLAEELGYPIVDGAKLEVCNDENTKPYATIIDGVGAIKGWVKSSAITISSAVTGSKAGLIGVNGETGGELKVSVTDAAAKNQTIKLDFYVYMTTGASEITLAPDDFGGYFYVEADTLYRNQSGKDMAATLTFPRVKIQSGFTMSMSATGDPSTFEFVMDAFPAYTYFDRAKQVVCDITIVSGELTGEDDKFHKLNADHTDAG